MPHATNAHLFENKMLAIALAICGQLSGGETGRAMLVVFDRAGFVDAVHFSNPLGDWNAFKQELASDGTAYLFYDPFDAPEYTWLEWRNLARDVAERLIGAHFESSDLMRTRSAADGSHGGDARGAFPEGWGVMF